MHIRMLIIGTATTALLAGSLLACTTTGPGGASIAASGNAPTAGPSAGTTVRPPPVPSAAASTAPMREAPAGFEAARLDILGAHPRARYSILAPVSWEPEGAFYVVPGEPFVAGMGVWIVGDVPSDPCGWATSRERPGPTVGELVNALRGQAMRDATDPVATTLAGHFGTYLKWSVPSDMEVVEGEFLDCDRTGDGHYDFVSWWGLSGGTRYQQVAGQIDEMWILDVDGRTVVVNSSFGPDPSARLRDAMAAVIGSIEFESWP